MSGRGGLLLSREMSGAAEPKGAGAVADDLRALPPDAAIHVINQWLEAHSLNRTSTSFSEEVLSDARLAGVPRVVPTQPTAATPSAPADKSQVGTAPTAEALPVPGTSSRPSKLYDVESVNASGIPEALLIKPEPIFHGERDERKREASQLYEFTMQVHFDPLTSGLESETHFRVEERQVIAGRYVVIQYLGSGTFCHTVQCEDLRGAGRNRFVCVKISKNTKDIFDQNLWEVKLLKLLRSKMDPSEVDRLPELLNVFYFRETLFIVYELLRDNLYHIYKYIEECKLPRYFTMERLQQVAKQCLLTLSSLHEHEVIHCDLKPENILISSLTHCKIKVIDYGNAYLHQDQRCSYVQSRAYRAPEVVLGLPYSPKVDIWSLGCILMELFTGRLLFDNRSVQALLASHVAVLGPLPKRLLSEGSLTEHYFAETSESAQLKNGLVGKHDGRLCRLRPRKTSLGALLAQHGCTDATVVSFVSSLMRADPKERPSAAEAIQHPWLLNVQLGAATPYSLNEADTMGEAGVRLRKKYTSLNDLHGLDETPDEADRMLRQEEEMPGPATPTAFREQCYLDRERLEKKRVREARKTASLSSSRLNSNTAEMPSPPSLDQMVIEER